MIENRFNLIDEPWIPVVDAGRVSLMQLFSHPEYRALGGNPVQKIALTKLLLAIAQAACTPEDDDDWAGLKPEGLAIKCLEYLDKWHGRFYLYGEKPFLQMPVLNRLIKDEEPKSFGSGFYPDVPSDNNTILNQAQLERKLGDAEKAVFIITMMNLALGGKRIHKNIPPLTPRYQGKTVSAKSAPGLGNYVGYLHSYLIGDSIQETIWLNLLTLEKIQGIKIWTSGLGAAPWEEMPSGESCEISMQLINSYMGCLVAMSRFMLLKDEGILYIEGIQYPSHKEGWFEPSISLDRGGESIRALWLDVDKKPWRMLTSLLSFLNAGNQKGFECLQIRFGFQRVKLRDKPIGVWSGGLKVRGSSGDQSVKQDDDFIESYVILPAPNSITGEDRSRWFSGLSEEMNEMESLSKTVDWATVSYFKNQNKKAKEQGEQASNLFWQLCERRFQDLVSACGDADQAHAMRRTFALFALKAYDTYCPKDTARQLDAWAKNRPNLSKYLKNPGKEAA
ncbi:CRISPR-associated protein, Cse1 family [Nitrosospira sp. Nsp14]|uniref:type I-E CRISPR-associated protein Cse1/CasA n=1 Tax=Nitrosospira sp. Nsp14 TaxID=1855333 RepID=UPI0008F191BB|nr:type I-E CRISPR-associated protein Cse1/CasA [Nitrosospira sp. Nsp14]SFH44833.1 CRISPR-associated protein, Cse1 family [Nitrosospira sp. Nsp14]